MEAMIYYGGDDSARFHSMLALQPDLVNIDYGDRVAQTAVEMGLR